MPASRPARRRQAARTCWRRRALRYFDRKGERAAVEKFYSAREYAPLWTQGGALTASAKGVIARLKDAASEGLNAADYPVPDFAAATSPDALADAELKLTSSMLDYARQAQSGRMHWSQLSSDILYPEHPTDPAEVLANVTGAKDASAALEGYNPPHKLYKELKAKLAELRGQGDGPVVTIAEGPALAFKAATKKQPAVTPEDPRVPQLRAKLDIAENPDDTKYDEKVAAAVRKFQEGADLKPTGVLDDKTVKAINSPKRDRQIDTVLVNMERWRWLPRQLGAPSLNNAYVILNIPDFTLKVMQGGAPGLDHARRDRQAGRPRHAVADRDDEVHHGQPDLERAAVDHLQRISAGAAAGSDRAATHGPAAGTQPRRQHPHLAAARRSQCARPHPLQLPEQVPGLSARHAGQASVRQGRARLQPWLHAGAESGSIRLDAAQHRDAGRLSYTPEKIRSMYGRSEIDLKFPTPIPVNITYQTAFVDDAGKLQFRKDIYGRDARMIEILKDSRGRDLETVVSHAQPSYARPTGSPLPSNVAFNDGYSSGPSFFERLFGGPPTPPAPVGRRGQQQQQQQRRVITR